MKYLKFSSKLLLTTAYSLSFLMNATPVCAQSCHDKDETDCHWSQHAIPIIGGAILVGGAALLATRYINDNSASSGSAGPRGSTGGDFVPDLNQQIDFNFNELDLTLRRDNPAVELADVLITPFVVAPDGTVTQGSPTAINNIATNTVNNIILSSIQVNNPLFGAYQVGVQITNTGATLNLVAIGTSLEARLKVEILTSRDMTITTTIERDPTFVNSLTFATNENFQVIADFTYGPGDIP